MSWTKTLMKVAIGIVVAKGVSTLTRKAGSGGLEDMMGDVLGGPARKPRSQREPDGGALGGLIEQISGAKRATPRRTAPAGGGDLLDQVLAGSKRMAGGPMVLPEPEEAVSAALLLRAVIQAVKCDGQMDEAEKQRLMAAMGDADAEAVRAVNAELARPVDVAGLAAQVPAGLEAQVYTASLMAVDLDHEAEAQYLHDLAQALELTPDEVNALHDRAGAPRLYR